MSKKSTLFLALALSSCSPENQATKKEIHSKYLSCYALAEADKRKCTFAISAKYIDKKQQQDEEYVRAFQFECEKLGFKQFINNHNLPCERIDDGPIFMKANKTYHVICKPKGQYLMQFNYETKEWNLINKE